MNIFNNNKAKNLAMEQAKKTKKNDVEDFGFDFNNIEFKSNSINQYANTSRTPRKFTRDEIRRYLPMNSGKKMASTDVVDMRRYVNKRTQQLQQRKLEEKRKKEELEEQKRKEELEEKKKKEELEERRRKELEEIKHKQELENQKIEEKSVKKRDTSPKAGKKSTKRKIDIDIINGGGFGNIF